MGTAGRDRAAGRDIDFGGVQSSQQSAEFVNLVNNVPTLSPCPTTQVMGKGQESIGSVPDYEVQGSTERRRTEARDRHSSRHALTGKLLQPFD